MSDLKAFAIRLGDRRRFRALRAELEDYVSEQLVELGIRDADIDVVAREAAAMIAAGRRHGRARLAPGKERRQR
jgi:hypothetical protein